MCMFLDISKTFYGRKLVHFLPKTKKNENEKCTFGWRRKWLKPSKNSHFRWRKWISVGLYSNLYSISIDQYFLCDGTCRYSIPGLFMLQANSVNISLKHAASVLVLDMHTGAFLWPPCVADVDIIFLPCGFYLSSSFFPRLISAVADWMSTILPHMMWP